MWLGVLLCWVRWYVLVWEVFDQVLEFVGYFGAVGVVELFVEFVVIEVVFECLFV